MDEQQSPLLQWRDDVQEIAEALARRSGKTISDVWAEALNLHDVRYATEVLLPDGRSYALPPDI